MTYQEIITRKIETAIDNEAMDIANAWLSTLEQDVWSRWNKDTNTTTPSQTPSWDKE